MGNSKLAGDQLLFTPLIPLSGGLSYMILVRDKKVGRVRIPSVTVENPPSLIAIYPSQDTLPENLLKLYFQFSVPMREGESLRHISLLNGKDQLVPDVFLDLRQELWNQDRTTLTLWLDPGRIKRELIPNQQMGNPLVKGERYTIRISGQWKDIKGIPLADTVARSFVVGYRDSISPDPARWLLQLPSPGTTQPLVIETDESLDYFLLNETVEFMNHKNERIKGALTVTGNESKIHFIPDTPWVAGSYRLQVASYLEDRAGNNLNKVFDRDIIQKQTMEEKTIFEKKFQIR